MTSKPVQNTNLIYWLYDTGLPASPARISPDRFLSAAQLFWRRARYLTSPWECSTIGRNERSSTQSSQRPCKLKPSKTHILRKVLWMKCVSDVPRSDSARKGPRSINRVSPTVAARLARRPGPLGLSQWPKRCFLAGASSQPANWQAE